MGDYCKIRWAESPSDSMSWKALASWRKINSLCWFYTLFFQIKSGPSSVSLAILLISLQKETGRLVKAINWHWLQDKTVSKITDAFVQCIVQNYWRQCLIKIQHLSGPKRLPIKQQITCLGLAADWQKSSFSSSLCDVSYYSTSIVLSKVWLERHSQYTRPL